MGPAGHPQIDFINLLRCCLHSPNQFHSHFIGFVHSSWPFGWPPLSFHSGLPSAPFHSSIKQRQRSLIDLLISLCSINHQSTLFCFIDSFHSLFFLQFHSFVVGCLGWLVFPLAEPLAGQPAHNRRRQQRQQPQPTTS